MFPSAGNLCVRGRRCPAFLCLLLLTFARPCLAPGQSTPTQPTPPPQLKPLPLPHLYWHFLIHQNDLDNFAAQQQAKGRDASALRNDLQNRLGFSDADYAPIRTASQELASALKPINDQLRSLAHTPGNASQAQALIAQRESCIDNEIYTLSLELSPQNKAALEKFMAQFFAPKPLSAHTHSTTASPAGKAVQP